uniref:gliding motility-associated C-terminal domain-containing protein n=1 Tax=uncultured Algibacter sp. TaxID=298659 RepID=UPI00262367F2
PDGETPTNPNDPCDFVSADVTVALGAAYLAADCDGDGVTNGDELTPPDGETPTNPNDPCDFVSADVTVALGAAYLAADCDGDGVTNGDELTPPDGETPTNPNDPCDFVDTDITVAVSGDYLVADCDGDGVTNGDELTPPDGETPTNPNDPCDYTISDITLVITSGVDCDGDGLTDQEEVDPNNDGDPSDQTSIPTDPCDPIATNCQASIEVTKTAQVSGTSLNDTIEYTIEVENTGNIILTGITLVDTFLDANGNTITLTELPVFDSADLGSPEGTLLAGEIATYSASFKITQSAIDAGGVSNSVIATANSSVGTVSDVSDDGDETTDGPDDDTDPTNDPTVTELGCLTVINEFSPNGDNLGDTLIIKCIENYPNNTLEVYNRWGNIVYKKRGYRNEDGWNGTSNGRVTINSEEKLPEGTYYYVLDFGDGSKPKVGWLYINR